MRRSLRLVAATLWLLNLGACAEESPARTPAALRSSPRAETSHAPTGGAPAPAHAPVNTLEIQQDAAQAASSVHVAVDRQLPERFARARALSVQRGSASYYADKFAGRTTASGAAYEPRGFTAAHRSLPFGTVLRVTRVDGGQVVYVRVTDRGPFGPRGRILDLSRAAAEQLDMLRSGVVKIKAEVVEYGAARKQRRRRR